MKFTRRHLLGLFMISLVHGREYTGKGFDAVSGEKTGFFHVENQNGIWWVIDPNGKGTLVRGVNVFRMSGWRCERLNNRKLYQENALKKYGSVEAWAKASVERLKRWGFNTVNEQYEINPIRSQEIAYTYLLSMAEGFTRWRDDSEEADKYRLVHKTWHSLPNVYHPDWKAYCEKTAQAKCAAFKDDPYLLGYFLDNERAWLGPERLTAETWRKPASHPAKIALVQMAMKYFGSIEAINRHWQTAYTSVDDFLNDRTAPIPGGKEATAFCRFFFRDVAERFLVISARRSGRSIPTTCSWGHGIIISMRFAAFWISWASIVTSFRPMTTPGSMWRRVFRRRGSQSGGSFTKPRGGLF